MKKILFLKTVFTIIAVWITLKTTAQQMSGSVQFNGIDNHIEVINSPLNVIDTGDFTFEAWVKGDELNDHPMIFSNRGNDPFGGGVILSFHALWGGSTSKMLNFQINAINHLIINNGSFNGSLLDNTCHHVAITREGYLLSFYADGVLFGTVVTSGSKSLGFNGPLLIGQDKATNNTFNGAISQVRIWSIAKSQSEIAANKDISLQGNESGLIAYWEMNDGSGQIVMDKTGQFDGQFGNTGGVDTQDPSWSVEGCIERVTSINSLEASELRLYPNPTESSMTVVLPEKGIKLALFDILGKNIRNIRTCEKETQLDLSNLPSGMYFLRADGYPVQKVIKD